MDKYGYTFTPEDLEKTAKDIQGAVQTPVVSNDYLKIEKPCATPVSKEPK